MIDGSGQHFARRGQLAALTTETPIGGLQFAFKSGQIVKNRCCHHEAAYPGYARSVITGRRRAPFFPRLVIPAIFAVSGAEARDRSAFAGAGLSVVCFAEVTRMLLTRVDVAFI